MIKNNNKSQGMPINVIIIAVLALMVLIILAVIFTGRVKIFSQTLEDCRAKQGDCEPIEKKKCDDNKALITNVKCPDPRQICCVQVFNPEK